MKERSLFTVAALAVVIITLYLWYLFLPVMAWGFPISIIGMFVVIFSIYVFIYRKKLNHDRLFVGGAIAVLVAFIVPFLISTPMFYADKYRNIIGEVKETELTQTLNPVDIDKIRIVDQDVATKMGEKKLGEDPALGSRAELGTFNIQSLNGELYWVAPILHSGFFKWLKFDTTPGYVKVSATNPRDVEMVIGSDIKYQPNAFFGSNLKRHIYLSGYMTQGLTDFSFEIDDNGKPYYVVTKYTKKVGFSGNDTTGILVVDVQSGDIFEYSSENAPTWIDRIQPEDVIISQLDNWGQYIHGWWNGSMFGAKEGVLRTTPGMSLVYSNGKSYWYSGISSIGSDQSTVGFVLVDTRNKEVTWYKQAGATEIAAMDSAEGRVQEKEYEASAPVLYNIAGIPTYVMSLKDNSGLVKMIAMVSVEDYTLVGIGKDVRTALRDYQSILVSKGNSVIPTGGSANLIEIRGKVIRFAMDVRGDETYYSFMLANRNKIFVSTSSLSSELPLTQIGDIVTIGFMETNNAVIDLTRFDNQHIELTESSLELNLSDNHNVLDN